MKLVRVHWILIKCFISIKNVGYENYRVMFYVAFFWFVDNLLFMLFYLSVFVATKRE